MFLFFNCDTEKNTKAFISVSFDFYFERKGKQGRLQKRILKHDGNAGAKSAGHSIFKGKSLVSVLFFTVLKETHGSDMIPPQKSGFESSPHSLHSNPKCSFRFKSPILGFWKETYP